MTKLINDRMETMAQTMKGLEFKGTKVTSKVLSELLHLDIPAISVCLSSLIKKNLVQKNGTTRNAVYSLTDYANTALNDGRLSIIISKKVEKREDVKKTLSPESIQRIKDLNNLLHEFEDIQEELIRLRDLVNKLESDNAVLRSTINKIKGLC